MKKLYTFKNGPVFFGPPCTYGRYFILRYSAKLGIAFGANYVTVFKDRPVLSAIKM